VGNQSVLHRVLQNTIYLHTYYTFGSLGFQETGSLGSYYFLEENFCLKINGINKGASIK
jgi:hypothetical protein